MTPPVPPAAGVAAEDRRRRSRRRKVSVDAGQFCVLRPVSVRYQLRQPPAKTVPRTRSCTQASNASRPQSFCLSVEGDLVALLDGMAEQRLDLLQRNGSGCENPRGGRTDGDFGNDPTFESLLAG